MVESSLLTKPEEKQHRNCHFYRPAPAGLLECRGIATPKFHNAKSLCYASRVYMQKKKGLSLEEMYFFPEMSFFPLAVKVYLKNVQVLLTGR